jgi:hypothetical protein
MGNNEDMKLLRLASLSPRNKYVFLFLSRVGYNAKKKEVVICSEFCFVLVKTKYLHVNFSQMP